MTKTMDLKPTQIDHLDRRCKLKFLDNEVTVGIVTIPTGGSRLLTAGAVILTQICVLHVREIIDCSLSTNSKLLACKL